MMLDRTENHSWNSYISKCNPQG